MNRKAVKEDSAFRSRLLQSAARLVKRHQADVLVLAEYTQDPQEMISLLNVNASGLFEHSQSNESKLAIFGRTTSTTLTTGREGKRFTIRRITPVNGHSMLLSAVHIPDKSQWTAQSQATEALWINNDILSEEKQVGHRRTLVLGDFNMNPFEFGMIAAGHFHGVITRTLAEKEQRTVMERHHRFFFNPMWSLYGNPYSEVPGTYYEWRSEPECYFWNMFDQVLLRPDLLAFFPLEKQRNNLRILTTDGKIRYLDNNGVPNGRLVSDHLPVMLRLEI